MAENAASCAHCGKEGVGFKRCSVCKDASYCGAACQNANWKRHKKGCAPPVTVHDVWKNVQAAHLAGDWRGVLKWEGRMDELIAQFGSDKGSHVILATFCRAHRIGWNSTGSTDHAHSIVALHKRHITVCGNLQRFRDQGEAMCESADMLALLENNTESSVYFQRARDVGAAHGFFSVESRACRGLGLVAMTEGRHEEGVALLQNALVAADLNELDNPLLAIGVLEVLIQALFTTHAIDEVEPLVLRYRGAAKAQSEKEGVLTYSELDSLFCSARLHQARGRPHKAAGEVRALLDLMRENEAAVQNMAASIQHSLERASEYLQVLHPEAGEKELIRAVAAQLAKLRAHVRSL